MRRIFLTFYLLVLLSMGLFYLMFDPIFDWYFHTFAKEEFDSYVSEISRGTLHLLEIDLEDVPRDRWETRIKALAPAFGYPLALKPMAAVGLEGEAAARLRDGGYVVQGHGDHVFHRMGRSDQVMVMGPIPDFGKTPHMLKAEMAVLAVFLIFMGVISMVWGQPLRRNLKRLMGAASRFGRGELETRAMVSKHSALYPLAQSFNAMADRIKRLIDSRKMLLNAVSHELRTPASRIRFGLEMADSPDAETRGKYLRGISKDVNELDAMVSELLLYARFDSENPELLLEEIPALEWLGQLAEKWENKREEIQFHIHKDGMPATVHGDHRYLNRATENIVSNAIRHARTRVDISLHVRDGRYHLQVEDDGPGIPETERTRVFDPFVRLDESRSRDSGGLGLGLAITRQIMEWHGGASTAASSRSGGARLLLSWPKPVSDSTGVMPP